ARRHPPRGGAARDSSSSNTVTYLQNDHLGSASLTTNNSGAAGAAQEFDPWGKVRSGGISQTKRNYTGQYLDETGLLFYTARYSWRKWVWSELAERVSSVMLKRRR